MRLQRALARAGVASRRRSEDLIRAGRVRVNGEVAALGVLVDPVRDAITVGNKQVRSVAEATIVLHKPTGVVVSRRDPEGRETVFDLVPEIPGLTYVGRLDIMSSGLQILTTDGELAHRLTHPRFEVPRTYLVRVRGRTAEGIREELGRPIVVDRRRVAITRASVRTHDGARNDITIELIEGRNRIVRRVCEQIGLVVERLVRLRHGPVKLSNLRESQWRHVTDRERRQLTSLKRSR